MGSTSDRNASGIRTGFISLPQKSCNNEYYDQAVLTAKIKEALIKKANNEELNLEKELLKLSSEEEALLTQIAEKTQSNETLKNKLADLNSSAFFYIR